MFSSCPVTARDEPLREHGAAAEDVGMTLHLRGHFLDLACDHVVGDIEGAEPELGKPIEHPSLGRDPVCHDHVERAQAVGRHNE
jgi:hypothetical protein